MRRFHPAAALRFLRKTLLVCLLPLLQVLLAWDWAALWPALRQEAALLALLLCLSVVLHRASGWALDEQGVLHLHWKLFFCWERTLRGDALAALTVERGLFARLTGAALVTLYPANQPEKGHAVRFYLYRKEAQQLAEQLMPAPREVYHRPAGREKLALSVLGAGGLSTLALLTLAVRESRRLPSDAQTIAFAQLSRLAALIARWLPAGVAWLLVLCGAWFGLTLGRSVCHTAHYEVWRGGGVLCSRGGLWRRFECRVRSACLNYADVQRTPVAWLLHSAPVYVSAGCYCGRLPMFVYRIGQEPLLEALLPDFCLPPAVRADPRGRSLIFFAPAGVPLGLCLLLAAVSRHVLPALTLPLLLCGAGFAVLLCAAGVGFVREGVFCREGRLALCRQQGVRLHGICVFSQNVCLTARQNPYACAAGRTDLILTFSGGVRLKVRSVPLRDAQACFEK